MEQELNEEQKPIEDAGPKISERASMLIDFIERAKWNVSVCESNRTHGSVRLGYLELYGTAPDASDEDKNALENERKALAENDKMQEEQERFLAYCQKELEEQRKKDEAAA